MKTLKQKMAARWGGFMSRLWRYRKAYRGHEQELRAERGRARHGLHTRKYLASLTKKTEIN